MGHIFPLGRKYADALDLQVLDENGKLVTVTMGSYGIGVSRAVAAIAENTHDELGLVWPREVAPADVHLVATGKDPAVYDAAADARRRASPRRACTVLYDDRPKVSPGVKFKDAELIGVPTIVVVGKGLADGVVEVKDRATRRAGGRRRSRDAVAHVVDDRARAGRQPDLGGLMAAGRRTGIEAVIFDWGGTLTPWHTIDFDAEARALAAAAVDADAAAAARRSRRRATWSGAARATTTPARRSPTSSSRPA